MLMCPIMMQTFSCSILICFIWHGIVHLMFFTQAYSIFCLHFVFIELPNFFKTTLLWWEHFWNANVQRLFVCSQSKKQTVLFAWMTWVYNIVLCNCIWLWSGWYHQEFAKQARYYLWWSRWRPRANRQWN